MSLHKYVKFEIAIKKTPKEVECTKRLIALRDKLEDDIRSEAYEITIRHFKQTYFNGCIKRKSCERRMAFHRAQS